MVGDDIENILDNLRHLKRGLHFIAVHPRVHQMQGDEARFILSQCKSCSFLNKLQRVHPDGEFLLIEPLDLEEHRILQRNPLLKTLHGKMDMIRQGQI
ncbi:hypothetical protein D3C75_820920 [compost metagenome]